MDQGRVLEECSRRKSIRGWMGGLLAAMVLILSSLGQMVGGWILAAIGLPVLAGALYLHWRFWRCPQCEGGLGQDWHYRHCPHCGTRLSV